MELGSSLLSWAKHICFYQAYSGAPDSGHGPLAEKWYRQLETTEQKFFTFSFQGEAPKNRESKADAFLLFVSWRGKNKGSSKITDEWMVQ